eukprot:801647-Prymnesium_polylepis.1
MRETIANPVKAHLQNPCQSVTYPRVGVRQAFTCPVAGAPLCREPRTPLAPPPPPWRARASPWVCYGTINENLLNAENENTYKARGAPLRVGARFRMQRHVPTPDPSSPVVEGSWGS